MQRIKQFPIKETLAELRNLQKRYPSKFKSLQMLIVLKQQGGISKYAVAEQLGSSQSSVGKWRTIYIEQGIAGLLVENRRGTKAGKITAPAEKQLTARLNNPKQGFRSFIEVQQWLAAEFGIEMEYHAVNKYVKRKFGAKLKVSRKSHVLKSPADEAVFKKPVRKTGTY
jgi:transposase